ncbi:hypothetical protein ANACOL_03319 [Anaerotruncus colihominis DSM 17241]|uniref:Uncharacterized protein n=1 Tax=Anaerotruncus colihominis DSM 17241 TaxID=445972 RepID=B0PEU1_9FIRM|nr:hypothetical protein ANACOL_03319 [Anaerotruncus colihominis DSM 17241]
MYDFFYVVYRPFNAYVAGIGYVTDLEANQLARPDAAGHLKPVCVNIIIKDALSAHDRCISAE